MRVGSTVCDAMVVYGGQIGRGVFTSDVFARPGQARPPCRRDAHRDTAPAPAPAPASSALPRTSPPAQKNAWVSRTGQPVTWRHSLAAGRGRRW